MTGLADARERYQVALRDLAELAAQDEAGVVDRATADELRRRYEAVAAVAARLVAAAGDHAHAETGDRIASAAEESTAERPLGGRRRVVGASVTAVAAIVAAVMVVGGSTSARPDGGFVTGNEAVEGGQSRAVGRDLSEVTEQEMEAVVAQNPDVVPMRLALAHRYLDRGDDSKALEHYVEVLDRQDSPEAAAHAGWVMFLGGEAEVARDLLDVSLEQAPDDPEALWFSANVALFAEDDPRTAVDIGERLLSRENLGTQREQVVDLLDQAHDQVAGR